MALDCASVAKTWEGEIILDYPCGSSALQEAMSQSSDGTVEARGGRSDEGTGSLVAIAEEGGLLLRVLQIWLSCADTLVLVIKTCLALLALRR